MVTLACCRRARPAAYHPARAEVTEPSAPTRIDVGPSVPSSNRVSCVGCITPAQGPATFVPERAENDGHLRALRTASTWVRRSTPCLIIHGHSLSSRLLWQALRVPFIWPDRTPVRSGCGGVSRFSWVEVQPR